MNDQALLYASLNVLDDGILLVDADGQVRMANERAARLLGVAVEALPGRPLREHFAFASAEADLRVGAESEPDDYILLRRADGSEVPVAYRCSQLAGDGGMRLLRLRETGPDMVCDLALRDTEIRLRAILDTIADGVVATDEKGAIQLFNPAAESLFGYRREEVLGRNVNLLMDSPDREAHDGYLASYLRTGHRKIIGIGREVYGRRKDGSRFPLYLSIGEALQGRQRIFVAVLHDLTARRQAEEKLLILSNAVEQSPNAVMITDLDGSIEYVNPSFSCLTGFSPQEIVGHKPSLLRSPDTSPEVHQGLWKSLLDGHDWQGEIQDRKKNGEVYWALETVSPVRSADGSVAHFLAIQQDITELKRDKKALQESEERFRQVAEMTGEWLWEQDPEGRYLYSSGAVTQVIGYGPEEILGKRYLDLLTPEDMQHWTAELPPTPQVQAPFYRLINRYRHKGGQEVFTESTGEPIFDNRRRIVKWRGVDHDITARKRYEDALRLRERAIEAASVGINISGAGETGYHNIYVNAALSRMTGYSREELLQRNMRMLQGPETDEAALNAMNAALKEGRGHELILKNYRKDGSWFWNELQVSPVRNEQGKLTHFIGIQSDVTERRRAEEERRDLEIAKQIQLSLLPKEPLNRVDLQVSGICLPARHVGGDYFDYFPSEGALDIVIADVSGHSVGAALIMTEVRSALKAQTVCTAADAVGRGPAEILAALNSLLFDDLNGADLFISMFYLRYEFATQRLRYANAGHNCALLIRAGRNRCELLDAEGMIFGVRTAVQFEEKDLVLNPRDKVLLYTDGITESQDTQGEFFGLSRLGSGLARLAPETPARTVDGLLAEMNGFCAGHPLDDDVSMVVVRRV
jgi:phosphoserine phosphatase RsbU/P